MPRQPRLDARVRVSRVSRDNGPGDWENEYLQEQGGSGEFHQAVAELARYLAVPTSAVVSV